MEAITVREYARLTSDAVPAPSLDRAHISASAFDWLCRLSSSFSAAGAALVEVEDRRWLRLDNYVGVIETPCGTRLEILPKHLDAVDEVSESRKLLRTMICASADLSAREAGLASIERFDTPLSEWVIGQFLSALQVLVKRGIRFDYQRIEDQARFVRGQLDVVKQARQPPGRSHVFHLRHDVFVANRPENRLIRLALEKALHATADPANWRLAQELRVLLDEVPLSTNIEQDFRLWRADRLMAHYQPVRGWAEMILYRQMPYSLRGAWHGVSFLFPMEKLFERYVAVCVRRALPANAHLSTQVASQYLCEHDGARIFRLQPDLIVRRGGESWLLDTKWKRLSGDRAQNYGLSQSDFYQLFAYGHRYLGGQGELFLIYPRVFGFDRVLPVFDFLGGLALSVVPFDVQHGTFPADALPFLNSEFARSVALQQ